MHVVLNKLPSIVYAKDAYVSLMEEGYALPIETRANATVLLFKDVEDHIDGNGMALLWMLEGEGTFFYEGDCLALKKGDVVVFDDNLEHGFEAQQYCIAASFDIGVEQDPSKDVVEHALDAFEKSHCPGVPFLSSSQNF